MKILLSILTVCIALHSNAQESNKYTISSNIDSSRILPRGDANDNVRTIFFTNITISTAPPSDSKDWGSVTSPNLQMLCNNDTIVIATNLFCCSGGYIKIRVFNGNFDYSYLSSSAIEEGFTQPNDESFNATLKLNKQPTCKSKETITGEFEGVVNNSASKTWRKVKLKILFRGSVSTLIHPEATKH